MSETERPRRRWIGRAARAASWAALGLGGLAVVLAGLLHVPPVQRAVSRAAVREAGRALEGSIEAGSIRWNLLAGTVELRDVFVRGEGERAGTEISVALARADLSVRHLLRGRVVVESAVVERPTARLALDEEGRLILPFLLAETDEEEPTTRPDVEVRDFRLSGGSFELTDRGKAARRVDGDDISLEGRLRLRDLASTGTLTLGNIGVSSAGHEPLRGSSLTARWTTRDDALDLVVRLVATEAGLAAGLDAAVHDLSGTPRWEATLTTDGTLAPLAARLAPDLGLGGKVDVRIVAKGRGTEPPSATATAHAETLTLLGRSFERVDFAGDLAGGLLRMGSLDVTAGQGRLYAEASGALQPAPKDVRFSIRAEKLDLARLLVLPPGAPTLAGTLDGTVEGTLARPTFEGITAAADLSVAGSRTGARNTLSPDGRARLRLASGILIAETVELAERTTKAGLSGAYDHRRGSLEGRVDVESANIGPWLALFGLEGKGQVTAHLSGGGPLARPALDGQLRARGLSISGALVDCVDLGAKSEGSRFAVSNGSFVAYEVSGGAEAEGQLPLPMVKSPRIDLRVRGLRFRGRPLPDVDAYATLGATIEARLETSDARLSASAVVPARGGFQAEATLVRFDLSPFAAALPPHLADFGGEVSGRFETSRTRSGPLVSAASVESGFVAAAGVRLSTSGARATVRDGTIDVEGLELRGNDGSFLSLSGRGASDGSAIEGRARFDVPDLSAFLPLFPPAAEGEARDPLAGSLSGDVRLSGTLERPGLTGTVTARDLAAFGLALSKLDAALKPDAEGRVSAAVTLSDLSWGAYRVDGARLDAVLAGSALTAEAEAFGGQLRLKATGSLDGPRPFDVSATLAAFDLAPLLRAAGGPADVATKASGTVRARGTVADLTSVSVDVDLDTFEATHPKGSLRAEEPVKVVIDRGRLDIRSLRLSGTKLALEATGGLPFEGSGTDRLSVTSSTDLAILLPLVDALDRASGRISTRLEIGGSFSNPDAVGSLTFEDVLLDGPGFPTPVERVTGTLVAKQGEIRTDSLSARVGGGSVVLSGAVSLAGGRPTGVDASLRARDLELEAGPDVQVRAAADLTAKGEWTAVTLGGEIRLEDVVYVPTVDVTGLLKSFRERRHRPAAASQVEPSPFLPRVSFDLAILARDAIHIEGNLGEAELGGILRVSGKLDAPVALGTISSTRGTIYLFGSSFDLTRCQLEFKDPLAIDPEVDVVATTTKEDEEITVRIDGRASMAQLLLSSTKGRSQADIISVLLGGSGTGSSGELTAAAARMAMRSAATPILGALGAQTDLEIVPLPTTPEGEEFLFSVGKDLGGGISATYYKGVSGETTDAIEMKWRISSRARGRLRQNQDGSLSGGFRIRRDLD